MGFTVLVRCLEMVGVKNAKAEVGLLGRVIRFQLLAG